MGKLAPRPKPAPTKASAPVVPQSRFSVWLVAVLLMLVTVALYWPATRCDFVNYDDPDFVTANSHVQAGLNWEGVKWAFRNTQQAAYWAPLTWLSHMLAWRLFGMNPWGHHLINVLLHAANTVLVFLVFRRMTGAMWRSALLAALFGLHPLRLESVVWVAERKDVLSAGLGFLALLFYARYAEGQSLKSKVQSQQPVSRNPRPATPNPSHLSRFTFHVSPSYLLSLFLFALALLSKPMLVTWPCVMLLLDYWPLRRLSFLTPHHFTTPLPRLALEKLPFFALAAAASVVTLVVQKGGGAVSAIEKLPLGARGGNALVSYCRYLGKMFWPTDLAVFYPYPGYWPLDKVLLAGGFILGLSVLLFMRRRRSPFLLMGWLWFVGTLVPVIGLIQSGAQAMADRFTYIPSLGVLILAIWGACDLTQRWRYRVLALSLAGSAAVVLCLVLTRQQLGYWQNSETLFRHVLAVTENNYQAQFNLGNALGSKGRVDEAIPLLQEAIRIKPDYAEAHNDLGTAFGIKGDTDEAIRQFQEAIRLKPNYAQARNNLGTALARKGQTAESLRQFQEAVRLKPNYAEVHNNLGATLNQQGRASEAILQFQEALRLKPDYAEARKNLDTVLAAQANKTKSPSPNP